MKLLNILADLIKTPHAPRFYRQLQDYYNNIGMYNEATALSLLIEQRFPENNDSTDNTFVANQE